MCSFEKRRGGGRAVSCLPGQIGCGHAIPVGKIRESAMILGIVGEKPFALVQAQIPARDDLSLLDGSCRVPGQVSFLEDLSQVPGSDGSVQAASVNPTIFNSQSSDRAVVAVEDVVVVATELPDHDLTVFAGRDQPSFPFGIGA